MFEEWGFLLGEIWVLLVLAALVGLIAGWIIWGRRSEVNIDTGEADSLRGDLGNCRGDLNSCRETGATQSARIVELEADLEACRASQVAVPAAVVAASVADADVDMSLDFDGDGVVEGKDEGVKPTTLDGPRDGKADDLKRIKGIGPKMEKLCNKLGFYHFDQIAGWTADETAWVDANLEGFKGRVTRDEWVDQAKIFAKGGETEFSKKVDKGGVY